MSGGNLANALSAVSDEAATGAQQAAVSSAAEETGAASTQMLVSADELSCGGVEEHVDAFLDQVRAA